MRMLQCAVSQVTIYYILNFVLISLSFQALGKRETLMFFNVSIKSAAVKRYFDIKKLETLCLFFGLEVTFPFKILSFSFFGILCLRCKSHEWYTYKTYKYSAYQCKVPHIEPTPRLNPLDFYQVVIYQRHLQETLNVSLSGREGYCDNNMWHHSIDTVLLRCQQTK